MALIIDEILLEPNGEPEITENFNRIIKLIAAVLPAVTNADVNKILSVNSLGEWVVTEAPSSLPDSTADDIGKVLTIDSNGVAAWTIPASGLPDVTSDDDGKFLVVNSEGEWEAKNIPIADDMTF